MFHDSGAMRICKEKLDLKKGLAKEASLRCSTSNVRQVCWMALLSCGLSIGQPTKFIGACYSNRVGEESMSDIRYKIWTTKFGNTATSAPKIQALPPTTEAFIENVKRSHLQTGTWKAALSLDPPALDAVEYGYVRHKPSKMLLPTTVADGVTLAPDEIKCNCEGVSACRNMRCSCSRSKLPCTLFCFVNAMLEMNV